MSRNSSRALWVLFSIVLSLCASIACAQSQPLKAADKLSSFQAGVSTGGDAAEKKAMDGAQVNVEWVARKSTPIAFRPFAATEGAVTQDSAGQAAAYAPTAVRIQALTPSSAVLVAKWEIRARDVSVRRLIQRWAQDAQYQLVWEANRDFPIEVEAILSGDFRDAVRAVMESLAQTDYPVQALINSNLRQIRVVRYLQGQAR